MESLSLQTANNNVLRKSCMVYGIELIAMTLSYLQGHLHSRV